MSEGEGETLPIGVVIPTLNAGPSLPAHLKQMRMWMELAEEVVVVDSFSNDGTFELLQAELRHPRLNLLQRPRGLYQSWNHGISQVSAKYTYISTIGDTITGEGLEHLVATADALGSDVVVSRPEFFDPHGHAIAGRSWPIHQLLTSGEFKEPFRLESWHAFAVAVFDIPEGILGSSASNLYRTDTLRKFPFPVDYGHAGDTAWGILHAFEASIAVTPRVFSRFTVHSNPAAVIGDDMKHLIGRLLDLADQSLRGVLENPATRAAAAKAGSVLAQLPSELKKLHECQGRYDQLRHEAWPWLLSSSAWKARAGRNRQRALVRQTKAGIRAQLGGSGISPA